MTLVQAARLRLRSRRFVPSFLVAARRAAVQAARSEGFRGGRMLIDRHRVFWIVDLWRDEPAMKAFRNSGAHQTSMPKMRVWCDEACFALWSQEGIELPDWESLHRRLEVNARYSTLTDPGDDHVRRLIPPVRSTRMVLEMPWRWRGRKS